MNETLTMRAIHEVLGEQATIWDAPWNRGIAIDDTEGLQKAAEEGLAITQKIYEYSLVPQKLVESVSPTPEQ